MNKIWDLLRKKVSSADLIRHSHHAAAVVYKGRVLAYGTARYKTHPLAAKFQTKIERIYLHAELDAIVKTISKYGSEILKECDLFVVRTTKAGFIGNSKPCEGCTKAIEAFGIRNTYWSE